ncbi:MAG TPA: TonB family protein [Saprospiraceae bacterium]|nr:TonB family protein [Saprospiraceae bacterium]
METSLWLQPQMNEITFEHRNKNYGAFPLRQEYYRTMAKSIMLSIGFFVLLFGGICLYLAKFSGLSNITDQIIERVVTLEPVYSVEPPKVKPQPQVMPSAIHSATSSLPTRVVIDETPLKSVNVPEAIEIALIDEGDTEIGNEIISDPGPGVGTIQEPVSNDIVESNTEVPIYLVDQKPEFPGGNEAMYKYLRGHLTYPAAARENGISGTVVVQFLVNASGDIEKVIILKSPSSLFNSISTSTIQGMPKWKPAIYKGKAVPVIFTLPLKFELL